MPLSSYYVLSEKYIGPPSVKDSPKIAPEKIKSMQFEAPTVGSYGHAAPTQILTKEGAVARTANNRFVASYGDFSKNGYFSQRDDFEIDGMKAAGEDARPNMFSLIPKMPDFGLIESPRLGMYFPNERDTPVGLRTSHDIVNAVNPNRFGYFQSKLANFNQDLRNLVYDNTNRLNYEASEWVNFLAKRGFSIDTTPNPGIIGLGVEKGDFLAAYYPGKGYLIREENFHNKAKNLISRYGLTDREAVEAMKRSVLLHEFGHVLGIRGSKKDEKLQGMLQAEFYSTMAQRFKGTTKERIYKALAREGMDYAKDNSSSLLDLMAGGSDKGGNDTRHLKHKFLKEAIELGVEDIDDYVNMRMEETLGPVLRGEPSYRNVKSKSSTSRKLEEMVDESDRKYESKSEKTYEGKIDKSKYKNMKDAREREAKSEKAETKEAETAEDTMAEAA